MFDNGHAAARRRLLLMGAVLSVSGCGGGDEASGEPPVAGTPPPPAVPPPPVAPPPPPIAPPAAAAPVIVVQPASATVAVGARPRLEVAASGDSLSYQWQRNGVAIAGATESRHIAGPLTLGDQGATYTARISNDRGSVQSAEAVIDVRRVALAVTSSGWQSVLAADGDGAVWEWTGTEPLAGTGAALPGTTIRRVAVGPVIDLDVHGVAVLALQGDGSVWTWGRDMNLGVLGQGSRDANLSFSDPRPVFGVADAVAIAAGVATQYAVTEDGEVLRWGVRDVHDPVTNRLTRLYDTRAYRWPALADVRRIVVSRGGAGAAAYALRSDGSVWAWGDNVNGQLGDGTMTGEAGTTGRLQPAPVSGIADVVALAATDSAATAVRADGTVWSWGTNWLGFAAATGVVARALRPTQVSGIGDAIDVWSSDRDVVVLRRDGSLLVWGQSIAPLAGPGGVTLGRTFTPVAVPGVADVVRVGVGWDFVIAVCGDGSLLTWGVERGQTGVYSSVPYRPTPVPVVGLDLVQAK